MSQYDDSGSSSFSNWPNDWIGVAVLKHNCWLLVQRKRLKKKMTKDCHCIDRQIQSFAK